MNRIALLRLLIIAAVLLSAHGADDWSTTTTSSRTRERVMEDYGRIPLEFERNDGQTDPSVRFLSRGAGYTLLLTSTGATFNLGRHGAGTGTSTIRLAFEGASDTPVVEGLDLGAGTSHYFIGSDPARWRRNIAHFGKVRYRDVYPGVDAVYYGNQSRLEFDLIVAPRVSPSRIAMRFSGIERLALDRQGNLELHLGARRLVQHRPVVYQETEGVRTSIAARYVLHESGLVGFELGEYDPTQTLVIDPILSYSTFLGGDRTDEGIAIAVDDAGNAYIAGNTGSLDFPTTSSAYLRFAGMDTVFVTKLNPTGTSLIYSTFLGGISSDQVSDIKVDRSGNAFVLGTAHGFDFPTTIGAYRERQVGPSDTFLAQLNSTGSDLVYSTLLGGGNQDWARSLAIDSAGRAFVSGFTNSDDFPTTANAVQRVLAGETDVFVTGVNASGTGLEFSTLLGGTALDRPDGIAVAPDGHIIVAGVTTSLNFPTTSGAFQLRHMGQTDAFVTKLTAQGSGLIFSTYLGGSNSELDAGVGVDAAGGIYVVGTTSSIDFPTTAGAPQPANRGNHDLFVTKIAATGAALSYSTYFGGSDYDRAGKFVVSDGGTVTLTGLTASSDLPLAGPIQHAIRGSFDALIARVNPTGSALTFSTYLGGSLWDRGTAVAVDNAGALYVTGATTSADFPISPGTFQTEGNDHFTLGPDAFVVRLADAPHVVLAPRNLVVSYIGGNTVTITWAEPFTTSPITEYVLEGGVVPGQVLASLPIPAPATTYTFTAPTGVFHIRLHAIAAGLKSTASNEVQIVVNLPVAPSPPRNVLGFSQGTSLGLAWTNTFDGGAPTGLIIDTQGPLTVSLPVQLRETFSLTDMPSGVYQLSIRAVNSSGISSPSASVRLLVPGACIGPPQAPTDLRLTSAGNLLTASWALPLTGPAPDSFVVAVTGSFQGTLRLAGRQISGVGAPGTYRVRVAAVNPCGTGPYTSAQTISIP